MIVAGECMRCRRRVHALDGIQRVIRRAMTTATRAAEIELLRVVHDDLTCHLEKCQRAGRAPEEGVPHV